MSKIWENCFKYKDKWAGIPISFTACVSIEANNGKYQFCVKISNYYSKCFDLASICYEDSFGIKVVDVKWKSCIRDLSISSSEISGSVSLEVKLCASIAGCTRWKSVGPSVPFRILFFAEPIAFIESNSYLDVTDYEPEVKLLIED